MTVNMLQVYVEASDPQACVPTKPPQPHHPEFFAVDGWTWCGSLMRLKKKPIFL